MVVPLSQEMCAALSTCCRQEVRRSFTTRTLCANVLRPSCGCSMLLVRGARRSATHSYTASLDSKRHPPLRSQQPESPWGHEPMPVANFRHDICRHGAAEDYLDRYPLYWATSNDQPAAVQWLLQHTCLPVVRISVVSCVGFVNSSEALPPALTWRDVITWL